MLKNLIKRLSEVYSQGRTQSKIDALRETVEVLSSSDLFERENYEALLQTTLELCVLDLNNDARKEKKSLERMAYTLGYKRG